MSTIDEIMGAIGRHGDDCIRDADAASASFEGLRKMIAAAPAEARREGAEAMREAAAWLCKQKAEREGAKAMEVEDDEPDMVDSLKATAWDFMVMESKIRALPLPTGPRQVVLLTDEQIDGLIGRHWGDTGVAVQSVADFAARVQAAVIAANVEFSGVPAGHSSNHPAGGTSAGTQG